MENVPPFIVITTILILTFAFLGFVFKVLGWFKIEPSDVKHFILIRGRAIAWSAYAIFATLITLYFIFVLSLFIAVVPLTLELVAFIVLIIWALLGIWSPTILKYFDSRRVIIMLQGVMLLLVTLTVVLFWFLEAPEFYIKLFVTLLLAAILMLFFGEKMYSKRKARKS